MIQKALEYLVGLGKNAVDYVNGRPYWMDSGKAIKEPTPETISLTTLSALIGYIAADCDRIIDRKIADRMTAHVISPTEVALYAPADGDFCVRPVLVRAKPMLPEFPFGQFMDGERMVIALQTAFARGMGDIAKVIAVAGSVSVGATRDYSDDGMSQAVSARVGIVTTADVAVPNPVSLAPFRTFPEVEQPLSDFVFRARSGGTDSKPTFALFEADGGAWRIEAMKRVADWLDSEATHTLADGPQVEGDDGVVFNVIY